MIIYLAKILGYKYLESKKIGSFFLILAYYFLRKDRSYEKYSAIYKRN